MNNIFYIFYLGLICVQLSGQGNCNFSLYGQVLDAATKEPLAFVNIYLEESESGTVTDQSGKFAIDDLCPMHYHIVLSHIGCEATFEHIDIVADTSVVFLMNHTAHTLDEITIKDKSSVVKSTQVVSQSIQDNASQHLAKQLESISGVSTLKNGASIGKPVVNGLFGNRVTILNNGIVQSGQQWGNDHSPEIDPLVANTIRLVDGAKSVAYPGGKVGGVVLIQPKRIDTEPHINGQYGYHFESNGFGHTLNAKVQQYNPSLAWKVIATAKKIGDRRAPNYWLNNTGAEEANLAIQLEKTIRDKWQSELYASTFNTTLGVLRGAHIGNTTDLENAIGRDIPFFTDESHSYVIEAPKQVVNHHLLKAKTLYQMTDDKWLQLQIAGQGNIRKEFDIRRGNRTEKAALHIRQWNAFAEANYHNNETAIHHQIGIQLNAVDNTNDSNTGIKPLIPDYIQYEAAIFGIVGKEWERSRMDFGFRVDNIYQNVATFGLSSNTEILRYSDNFQNILTSLDLQTELSEVVATKLILAFATRNPAINERFSQGLHQGVSGIEEGRVYLNPEQSTKITAQIDVKPTKSMTLTVKPYLQSIRDYIYLSPLADLRLTIRGAFIVYQYDQTNALLTGIDANYQWQITHSLDVKASYSYLRGRDTSRDIPLVYMPANNASLAAAYEFANPLEVGRLRLQNTKVGVSAKHVFEQKNYVPEVEILAPPSAYTLLGVNLSSDVQLSRQRLRFTLAIDNLLNTTYRDYLNRLRYFSDELGINVRAGVVIKF